MTAKIISVVNQKGGTSKSSFAINFSGSAALRGFKVLLVDADKQNSAIKWASQAPEDTPFPAAVINLAAAEGKMHREIQKHLDNYDLIVIDCPGSVDSPTPSSALLISDLAICPCKPSPVDVWATDRPKQLIEQARVVNESLQVRQLVSQVEGRSAVESAMIETMREDEEMPFLTNVMKRRAAYVESALYGNSVHVTKNKAAISEMETLVDEVFEILGLPTKSQQLKAAKQAEKKAQSVKGKNKGVAA